MYDVLKATIAAITAPGEMFEIKETEISGVPFRVWANAPGSLRDVWLSSAQFGDRDFLIYDDERITYAQAHEQVSRIANWMITNGIQQHDRVAIAMRNYPEWMLAYWAITCIGAVPVGVNAWWVAEELKYGLEDSAAKLLVCDSERLARFEAIRSHFTNVAVVTVRMDSPPTWAIGWDDVLQTESELPEVNISPDDDACIFYTSGTTGQPKGAQLTHYGCTNNIFTTLFSNVSQLVAAATAMGTEPLNPFAEGAPQIGAIAATPLFHVTANNCVAQAVTAGGGKLVHMYKWDAVETLRIIEEEKITNFTGVPTMAREIITHPDFATYDTSSLNFLSGGGAPVQPDLIEKIDEIGGGTQPGQGYGLTEVCGLLAASCDIYLKDKPASAGRISPIFDVKSVDAADQELLVGEVGEICVRGVQVIKGYLNKPEATAETIVDGWLHTGDIGYVDEDEFVFLVDRAKDMVLRGGENVYSNEVETAIYKHPDVAECAVFSVPDERLGEEVGAAIFLAPGRNSDAQDIRDFCGDKLAAFKVPRYIWILDRPLPRTATGKFVKRELQEALGPADAA
jgi:acyl-CoA synthetase (AMP-forming)/AMP-acid ligase II